MLTALKNLGRTAIPKPIFSLAQPYYHGLMATIASAYYGQPSQKLIVIGVTGTAGKSTVVNMLATILDHAGHKTGFSTTANYSDGNREYVNEHGLSMPGGFMLQQQLCAMVDNGCTYAIIEATSEGLAQNRHLGIKFDVALLTNLAPAHIDAHGNFDNYRAAKGKLFTALSSQGQQIIGVNLDTPEISYFLNFKAAKKFGITLKDVTAPNNLTVYKPTQVSAEPTIKFTLNDVPFELNLLGEFNVYNAVMTAACANVLGIDLAKAAKALQQFTGVAGRMQNIPNSRKIQIFVDYAPEPSAMLNALTTVNQLPHRKIIHVFGSTGGHRDISKRYEFGKISAQLADTIIITNDDVYDSDPELIAQNIEQGINQTVAKKVTEVLTVLDRRRAISHALQIAQSEDIVIVTGKGSEQFLVLPSNKRIAWNEPSVVQEELTKL